MKLKPLVEAILYALAEMRHGPKVRTWGLGIHAYYGAGFDTVSR